MSDDPCPHPLVTRWLDEQAWTCDECGHRFVSTTADELTQHDIEHGIYQFPEEA